MHNIQVGDRFHYLTVFSIEDKLIRSVCVCGAERLHHYGILLRNERYSCGCKSGELVSAQNTQHGGSRTRLYRIWASMRARCGDRNATAYKDYGGRGIKVCPEWEDSQSFPVFRDWALSHGYADDLTIDRIDVNGDYCPDNCRWATKETQANNKRKSVRVIAFGEAKTVAQWARDSRCVVKPYVLRSRISAGWNVEAALSTTANQ